MIKQNIRSVLRSMGYRFIPNRSLAVKPVVRTLFIVAFTPNETQWYQSFIGADNETHVYVSRIIDNFVISEIDLNDDQVEDLKNQIYSAEALANLGVGFGDVSFTTSEEFVNELMESF